MHQNAQKAPYITTFVTWYGLYGRGDSYMSQILAAVSGANFPRAWVHHERLHVEPRDPSR
jgi:hypothetical protein